MRSRAKELQDEFYQGFLKIPDDTYDALKKSWEDFAVAVKDLGDTFYEKVSGIEQRFFQQAEKERTGGGAFRVQTIDLPSSQKGALQSQIDYFNQYLKKSFPQYQLNDEEFGVIFKDNVTDTLHGDNLAIKLALEKLIDVNQKQLDGIYNLPEGATGFLPYELFQAISPAGAGTGGESANLTGGLTFKGEQTDAYKNGEFYLENTLSKALDRNEPLYGGFTKFRGDQGFAPRQEHNQFGGDLGYAPRSNETTTPTEPYNPGGFGNVTSAFNSILQTLRDIIGSTGAGIRSPFGSATESQQVPEVSNKLDISIDSNVQLMVDGRVLADIVKSYLASELLQAQQTQSTVTRKYVI